jgi:NAD-dependent DNA ligase
MPYRCPVCGAGVEDAYERCHRPDCPVVLTQEQLRVLWARSQEELPGMSERAVQFLVGYCCGFVMGAGLAVAVLAAWT